MVGGAADSVVTIYGDGELIELLRPLNTTDASVRSISSLLNTVFLTSSVDLVEADGASGKDRSGSIQLSKDDYLGKSVSGWAEVKKAAMHKCPRCWTFTAPNEESLCMRCEEVVKS